ncbi:hypothetical protein SAMN06264855_105128 [Halorubrum vacuolatum]|uniref:Uncharacterized protein n=1 Tax=Halorubrum vacuolatum TaxID=63740 RepID=A0A238W5C1_HALVU|nr:hypothetical protein SAMN06264855_105128 [Halorubrum vacuolatum]
MFLQTQMIGRLYLKKNNIILMRTSMNLIVVRYTVIVT